MATATDAFRNAGMSIGYLPALAATATARSYIRLETAADSALATMYLSSPSAFTSPDAGVASAAGVASELNAVAGTIAKVGIFNGLGARQITFTIATSTASAMDCVIGNLTLTNGDRIDCTVFTLTVAPTSST